MQQHPIPQNITAYKFRLVGNMTLKQFFELLIGVGGAILIYNTNLIVPIKYPLVLFFVIFGVALAFIPINDRPLDQWIVAYIKAIYRPTNFIWKKTAMVPEFFEYAPKTQIDPADSQEVMKALIERKRAGLSSFLQTLPSDHLLTNLEKVEQQSLSEIGELFNASDLTRVASTNIAMPTTSLNISYAPTTQVHETTTIAQPEQKSRHFFGGVVKDKAVVVEKPTEEKKEEIVEEIPVSQEAQPLTEKVAKSRKKAASADAQTSTKLPFPSTPTTKNTVVGMVLTQDEKIIENAIIEIRDETHTPVRATKTNKLGQFFSTTPLKNGTYEIEVEKEGFNFDILRLDLRGKIVDPLKIQAK
jgi:hypothetical protein